MQPVINLPGAAAHICNTEPCGTQTVDLLKNANVDQNIFCGLTSKVFDKLENKVKT